jgi:outer membrane protein TolC
VIQRHHPLPIGSLNVPSKSFDVTNLIDKAQEGRVDIASNKASVESASANLELVQANRNIDFMPGVYYTETPPYVSSGTNYGSQKSLAFLTIPLGDKLFDNSRCSKCIQYRYRTADKFVCY